jgi:hypothetical protein
MVRVRLSSTRRVCPARRYRSYTATVSELQRLVKQRPDLAKLWSTQERYGLQTAGLCEGTPCMNWVLEVTDHAARARVRAGARARASSSPYAGEDRLT